MIRDNGRGRYGSVGPAKDAQAQSIFVNALPVRSDIEFAPIFANEREEAA